MAHEIHSNDTFGEVRSNGQRAWHGLGMEIEEGLNAAEAFRHIGLDWSTEMAPLYAVAGEGQDQVRLPIEDKFAHVRSDNKQVLGLVSDGYEPIENMQLAEFADTLAGLDKAVSIETAGSLYNSKRVFALVRLPKDIEVVEGDVLQQYVLVSNGHGGFAAFAAYPTSVRVVCANTLRWSEQDMAKGVKFRHTGDIEQKQKAAQAALGLVTKEAEKFETQVRRLAATQWNSEQIRDYMAFMWEKMFVRIDPNDDNAAKLMERRDAYVKHWMALLDDERQNIKGIRGTAWAAYNALSTWCDHERGRFQSIAKSDARVHSNLFGTSQDNKLRAFKQALTLSAS